MCRCIAGFENNVEIYFIMSLQSVPIVFEKNEGERERSQHYQKGKNHLLVKIHGLSVMGLELHSARTFTLPLYLSFVFMEGRLKTVKFVFPPVVPWDKPG
jgi:hypothetical protein